MILGWYDAIVTAVSELAGAPGAEPGAAGVAAFSQLADRLRGVIAAGDPGQSLLAAAAQHVGRSGALTTDDAVSNAAVLMFGGIETTEGMITNAAWHLLSHPDQLAAGPRRPGTAAQRHRGIAAAGAGRGRGGPLRHPGRHARRRDWCARATWSPCRWPGRAGTRRCSPTRTGSRSGARTRTGTWPSPAARTSAWACIWPGWKPTPRSAALLRAARAAARPGPAHRPAAGPGVPQAGRAAGALGRRMMLRRPGSSR